MRPVGAPQHAIGKGLDQQAAERDDVFVWRSRSKMQQDGIKVTFFADNLVCRSSGFVNKVRVEDIELKFDLAFNFAILQSIYSRTL